MIVSQGGRRQGGFVAILAVLVALPACQSPGAAPPPMVSSSDGSTSRFALRPILDGAGYRPYYLGGYAGASYGPGVFGREVTPAVPGRLIGPSNVTVNSGTWSPE
jgi:hypothetical protein